MKRGKLLILCLGAILILAGLAWGQDSLNVALQYQYRMWGDARDVVISGNYTYVADEWGGMRVVDVTNPAAPFEVGYCILPGETYRVNISGNYAYLAQTVNGIWIVDISNPESPRAVGHCTPPGNCWEVAVSGSYAYLANNTYGLCVVDVSNPSNPVEVGHCATPSEAQGVAVSGNYAYVAAWPNGMYVVDVSHPQAPVVAGFCNEPNGFGGVEVNGNYAYLAGGSPAGLRVINVANPHAPVLTGTCLTPGQCADVKISGQIAYIADNTGGLQLINVSNPYAPMNVGGLDPGGHAMGVAASGSHAFTACVSAGMRVFDVSNPSLPVLLTTYKTQGMTCAAAFGNGSYLACTNEYYGGLRILDATNPADPVDIGRLNFPAGTNGVAASGSYLYVAGTNSLHVVNVANPSAPVEVGSAATPGLAATVVISGSYAYLASESYGLRVVNIANPAAPMEVGAYDNESSILDVAVSGSHAYLADADKGLIVVNISDPTHPVPVGYSGQVGLGASAVAVVGSYVFEAVESSLAVVDVSDPQHPVRVNELTYGYGIGELTASGSYLFAAHTSRGLRVLDISNPLTPMEVGYYMPTTWGECIAVSNSRVYMLGQWSECFWILQFSGPQMTVNLSPLSPPIVIPAPGGSFQFNAAVANPGTGSGPCNVWIMQQTPSQIWQGPMMGPLSLILPAGGNLTRLRTQNVPASAAPGVYTYRGYIGVYQGSKWDSSSFTYTKLTTGDGPMVSDWSCTEGETQAAGAQPSAFNLCRVSPNPFNPSTAISYQLSAISHVKLTVYDTAGRLVATLVDGMRVAGTHEVTFDGSRLASGIYVAKLEAGDFSAVQKLVLMK